MLLGLFLLQGCATGGGGATAGGRASPPQAAGAKPEAAHAAAPAAALRPEEEATAVADTVSLTGRELGSMWTFENPPLDRWEERYDFSATPEWLKHVRLSSLRYGQICSASFVSPEGLVMTNHHCARDCVEKVSTADTDHVEEGFHARTRSDEKLCPGLQLDQLVEIREVTDRIRSAVPRGATDEEAVRAREEERQAVVEACESGNNLRCQVVSLYHGGQYQLYKYRSYSPVKLVFAPELQAGFYGGDPDNFTYPRYNLDVSFVRAYRSDSTTAVQPDHYLEWDPEGAEEGELVFITGNPGSTSRLFTVSQLLYERAFRHPFLLDFLREQRDFLQEIADRGPQAERQVRDQLFSVENSIKAFDGELEGLEDLNLLGRKIRWERRFRERVHSDSTLRRQYGDLWSEIADIQAEKLEIAARRRLTDPSFIGAPQVRLAGRLVSYLRQKELTEGQRAEGVDADSLEQMAARLRGRTRLSPAQGARILAIRLRLARRWLPGDDPLRAVVKQGESPAEAARRLVESSRIGQRSFRRGLMEAGAAALDTLSDPLVRLVSDMESRHRELQPRWDELSARESAAEERLADALFAVFGTQIPPDATFTLRISDGQVRRYPYNGTFAPPHTSFHGLYARAAEFRGEMPWTLPSSFRGIVDSLDLSTPLNFVTTNDITGGNSGSPMIDRSGRVVGIAFDGNIQQLPNEFLYRSHQARTVAVHSAGITEALREIYHAERLLEELLGSGGSGERSKGGGEQDQDRPH